MAGAPTGEASAAPARVLRDVREPMPVRRSAAATAGHGKIVSGRGQSANAWQHLALGALNVVLEVDFDPFGFPHFASARGR